MEAKDIIEHFNSAAPSWDAEMVRNERVIRMILDHAGVRAGVDVLDVACGTGVLIPDYLERHAASVTAVDICPGMIEIAKRKFPQENVRFICMDVEEVSWGPCFDCIVIYNALPHFCDAARLIRHLSRMLKPGGILTAAHGMSREKLLRHHARRANRVSVELMEVEELAALFPRELEITTLISDQDMYQVCGKKRLVEDEFSDPSSCVFARSIV